MLKEFRVGLGVNRIHIVIIATFILHPPPHHHHHHHHHLHCHHHHCYHDIITIVITMLKECRVGLGKRLERQSRILIRAHATSAS